jgi:ATP-binding cassette subfamily C protein CydC
VVTAVALGAATIAGGIGLMGTAAFLIASAALRPSIAELQVAIVGVRFFGLSRGILRYLERLVSHGLTLRLLGRLRSFFFQALEPLAPAKTIELKSSDLLTRAVTDVESLQELFIRAVAPPMVAVVVMLGAALIVGAHAPELGWVFVGLFAFVAVSVPVGVLVLKRASEDDLSRARAELAAALTDGVQGMADLLAFGRGRRQEAMVRRLSSSTERIRESSARREALGTAGVTFGTHASVWLVLVLAIPMVREGRFTGVGLAVICLVVMAAFEAVQPLPAAARGLADQLAAAERVFAILDDQPSVEDAPAEGVSEELVGTDVELRGLGFTYPGNHRPALVDVDLEIRTGSRIAVVGPSGAGKSTLASLLLRFWDPSEGEIRLAGRPLREWPLERLRETIGVLPQFTELFAGTIRENLLLAAPEAGGDLLEGAVARAGLLETIQAFPDGWDTWIGEHGQQLSGGQRRRLALARLVLRDPAVAVLDEPATGLDAVTERRVMDAVFELFEGRTTVVITHRLVAMDRFDEIVVLDDGRIVERGSHDELLVCGGLYQTLHAPGSA